MSSEIISIIEGPRIPKADLLNWVNTLLHLHLSKIEHLSSGAAYCQLIDILYPGSIPLQKIIWLSQYDHEFKSNFKLLQQAFDKNNVQKRIDTEKLIQARYQDNLEFLQWFKRFFELNCPSDLDYNPEERRRHAKTPWDTPEKRRRSGERSSNPSPKNCSPRGQSPGLRIPVSPSSKTMEKFERAEKQGQEIKELKAALLGAEKERDFFLSKLRSIGAYCEAHKSEQSEHLMSIQKILQASETDKVSSNENGSVL